MIAARTFLALPLVPTFFPEISEVLSALRNKITGVRWGNTEEVHVTLHFFGATSDEELCAIPPLVSQVTEKFEPLELALEGLGCFPNPQKPRVIWLGLSGDTARLEKLQQDLETKLGAAGFSGEDHPFRPHATIGRVKGFLEAASTYGSASPVSRSASKIIDRVVLFQSRLSPQGAHYEILQTFPFSEKPRPAAS